MSKTICISNQKGGAGKTSVTHNLGCLLAVKFDKKILFVDVDGQANMTSVLGIDPDEISSPISQLFEGSKKPTKDFILETSIKNVSLFPSNQETFGAEKKLYDRTGREFVLSDSLEQIKNNYDFIFIDTPPNLGIITLNSLIASNGIIFVYTASDFSLDGLSQIVGSISEIQENRRFNLNNTTILGAILNRYRISNKTVNKELKEALDGLSIIPKYFSPISESTEIEKAQFKHLPIISYNGSHKIAKDFKKFAEEFLECLD